MLREKILTSFYSLRFVREVAILDDIPKPARIIASPQVKHPGLFIETLCDLAEHPEILRPQVESSLRTAKVKAVIAQITLGVLAMVTDALGATGLWLDRERQLISD
jgi:hypothetical protein